MRILFIILKKEFKQIFRNKMMLPIIFLMPFLQTLILVYAATLELQNASIAIVDMDNSAFSHKLTSKFVASPFFDVDLQHNHNNIENDLLNDNAKAVLIIPKDFENNLRAGVPTKLQLNINAIDGQGAGLIHIYVNQTLLSLLKDSHIFMKSGNYKVLPSKIETKSRYWYNPELNFKHFMLPGILVILITMIGMFLTALNLVREKELGTIEQINVTPIKKWQFLAGKLIPFWIIGLFDLSLGLGIGIVFFDLPFVGSVLSLFIFASLYLFTAIGFGLLLANLSSTQQQAMFTMFFFYLIFVLMGGIFTSVESMPDWAQILNKINPIYYFMIIIRSILLKGAEIKDLLPEFFSLLIYGCITMSVAVWGYSKVK